MIIYFQPVKCGLVPGVGYGIRDLTPAEMDDWKKKKDVS